MSETLIDSYSESNKSSDSYMAELVRGQSFANTNTIKISSVKFYMQRYNNPAGNAYAYLYAHSGTYGTNSVPTGSPLATSDPVAASSISASAFELVTFTFSGSNKYEMQANTKYVIVVGNSAWDGTACLRLAYDGTSPTHGGNFTDTAGNYNASRDACFYVYGESSTTYEKTITAVANSSASEAKTTQKTIAPVANSSGILASAAVLMYNQSITAIANATASVSKIISKSVNAQTASSATNGKAISKYITAVVNTSSEIRKSISKHITTVVTASASLSNAVINIFEHTTTSVANASASVSKIVSKSINAIASANSIITKTVSKYINTSVQTTTNTVKTANKSINPTANATSSVAGETQESGEWVSIGVNESSSLSHVFASNFFQNDKEYEWRVRSYDSTHESWYDWSAVATFNTINPPSITNKTLEQDDVIQVQVATVSAVLTSIYQRQCKLTVYVSDTVDFAESTVDETLFKDSGESFEVNAIFPYPNIWYVKYVAEDSTGLITTEIITVDVIQTLYFISEPSINLQAPQATHVKVRVKGSSPEVSYTAHSTPEAGANDIIIRLVEIDDGTVGVCQSVAEQLIARWGREQISISGDIDLNIKLSFDKKIRVIDAQSGIDGDYILQSKSHNLANMTTSIQVGDIILDDSELLARIIDKLSQ